MKKLFFLLLGIAIAIPALCQLDTLREGDLYLFPKNATIVKEPSRILMRVKMGEVYDHVMMGGLKHWYMVQSNIDTLNQSGDKIRLLSIQVPYAMYFGLAERKQLQDLINSFINPTEPEPQKPDSVYSIDNTFSDQRNNYGPNWRHAEGGSWNENHHNKTASYTTIIDSVKIVFNGYKVEWWTEKRMNHGIASVSIDGGAEVEVDLYDSTGINNTQKVWTSPDLENKTHVLKVRMAGKKNPTWQTDFPEGHAKRAEAQQDNIIHDRVVVYTKQ